MSERTPDIPPEYDDSVKPAEKKVVVVDASQAVEDTARDVAEASLTADERELRGIRGLVTKIWKHNLAEEYYRQKEIVTVRKGLHAAEDEGRLEDSALDTEARRAIWKRFEQDYDETVHREAGEEREVLGDSAAEQDVQSHVRDLVERYATGELSGEAFQSEKVRLFSELKGLHPGVLTKGDLFADNLFEIAKESRLAIESGLSLEDLDMDFEIVVGRASPGVRTEADFSQVDRMVERLQRTKVGRWVNETTMAAGLSVLSIVAQNVSRSVTRSRALAVASLGGTTAVAAGIAGARESRRFTEERRQHSRESAQGKEVLTGERRIEMESFRYRTEDASDLADQLETSIYDRNADGDLVPRELTDSQRHEALARLIDLEARVSLSDREQIDLISYSEDHVEQERLRLDILRAQAKVDLLSQINIPDGMDQDEYLEELRTAAVCELREEEGGLNQLDRLFAQAKRKRVAKAAAIGALTGLVVGGVVQETYAALSDKQLGVIEGVTSDKSDGSNTALEQLRQLITGDRPETMIRPGQSVEMPYGVEVTKQPDGSFSLTKHGEVVDERALLNRHGELPEPNRELLAEHGIDATQTTIEITDQKVVERSPEEYLRHHPESVTRVERELWYDNNTPGVYDQNELRLYHGGVEGTGLDHQGNFTYTVSSMTPDGSYHEGLSADAARLAEQGKLHLNLSLSENSQDRVFSVPIDRHGDVVIDKHSEVAQLFFDKVDGKAEFLGKYNEVVQVTGQEGGVEHVRMLATEVGPGQPAVQDVVTTSKTVPTVHLTSGVIEEHPPMAIPPVIPLRARRPMERSDEALPPPAEMPYGPYGVEYGGEAPVDPDISPRLEEDPGTDLSLSEEIDWHLDRQRRERGEEYLDELDRNVAGAAYLSELPSDTRLMVAMPVAAAYEADNIYRTLELYAAQGDDALRQTVMVLNVNWISDADQSEVARTLAEIERAQRDFPDLQVAFYTKEYSREWVDERDGKIYGEVIKGLYDTAMRSVQQAQSDGRLHSDNLWLVTNDADAQGLSPTYLNSYLRATESHPQADMMSGFLRWGTKEYADYPGYGFTMSVMEAMQQKLKRQPTHSVTSPGANTAVKLATLAAIGGANGRMGEGADTNLSRRVRRARGINADAFGPSDSVRYRDPDSKRTVTGKGSAQRLGVPVSAIIDTDPNRLLRTYLDDVPVIDAWNGFSEGGYQPRGEAKASEKENVERDYDKICRRIERQISALWQWYEIDEIYRAGISEVIPERINGRLLWGVTGTENSPRFRLTPYGKRWLKPRLASGAAAMSDAYAKRKRRMTGR